MKRSAEHLPRALSDYRLSWTARGIYAAMILLSDLEEITIDSLVDRGASGPHVVYSGMRQLKKAGYVVMARHSTGLVTYSLGTPS